MITQLHLVEIKLLHDLCCGLVNSLFLELEGSSILSCLGASDATVAKRRLLYPPDTRQVLEAPQEKGMLVPFPWGKSAGPPIALLRSASAISQA